MIGKLQQKILYNSELPRLKWALANDEMNIELKLFNLFASLALTSRCAI